MPVKLKSEHVIYIFLLICIMTLCIESIYYKDKLSQKEKELSDLRAKNNSAAVVFTATELHGNIGLEYFTCYLTTAAQQKKK